MVGVVVTVAGVAVKVVLVVLRVVRARSLILWTSSIIMSLEFVLEIG